MVRILHVIDSLDLGGAQTALLNLVKYADRSHFQHEVATMHGEGMFAEAFRSLGVPVHSLSAHRWPPGYLAHLPRLLRRGKFNVVQCHLFASNWIAKPLAAACGARCIYHHDQCNDAFRTGSPIAIFADALTNLLSTRILAVSRSVEDFNLRVEGIDPDRVAYFPNSVDLAEFGFADGAAKQTARRSLGLPAEAFIIGGVGRLTPQKNFGLLLETAEGLLNENTIVALFGSGPEEAQLRDRAGSRVHFAGTVADRRAIYAAIDVLALPSRFEGLPMTVLEAMASGVPVVASAVDGVREIATDGKNALLFPSGDATALRAALEKLRVNSELRRRLATSARELVEQRFDARKLAVQLESWYLHDLAHAD
jgi:glycosyltransferase involved in cell wall biosynthesis